MENRKRIFNIAAEFDLDKKPDWLDGFRKKYDKPHRYHITLKNATYFNDDIESIKFDLANILEKYNEIRVIFNKIFMGNASSGGCIMIKSKENHELLRLQKEIVDKFSKYGKNIKKEYREFELNFEPHITIARHLSSEQFEKARKNLRNDLFCEAIIGKISLTTPKGNTVDEWNDVNNKIIYKLEKE